MFQQRQQNQGYGPRGQEDRKSQRDQRMTGSHQARGPGVSKPDNTKNKSGPADNKNKADRNGTDVGNSTAPAGDLPKTTININRRMYALNTNRTSLLLTPTKLHTDSRQAPQRLA